jgi:hypothetical protein
MREAANIKAKLKYFDITDAAVVILPSGVAI